MNASQPKRRRAGVTRTDWILSGVAVLLVVGLIVVLLPATSCVHYLPPRTECKNNLKQLALAMHFYHDTYRSFPPAYVADKNGRPMHSWRVLLLPFLDRPDLYKRYRFDEPWDGPHNRMLAANMPSIFRCPADPGPETNTSYFVVVGPRTIFPGAASVGIRDISDGTTTTILLAEAAESGVNWLEPRDLTHEEALRGINAKTGFGVSSHHHGGAMVVFADGHAQFLSDDTSVDKLRLFLERNDGQTVTLPAY
jgi:prepilin-type processing-associated H-X9-DG protein